MDVDHRVLPLERSLGPVEVRDLWHRYDGAAEDWTLRGIDLELGEGELVGLLGPSGCGKTTLLRLIAGFERPVRGSVHLQHRPVAGDGHWLPPERRGIGMVLAFVRDGSIGAGSPCPVAKRTALPGYPPNRSR